MGEGSARRSKSGSFFSVGEPGVELGVLVSQRKKGAGSSTAGGSLLIHHQGPGLVPGNVEDNLRLAHFTIRGMWGVSLLEEVPHQGGLREKARERAVRGGCEVAESKLFSHRGLMRIVIIAPSPVLTAMKWQPYPIDSTEVICACLLYAQ